MQESHQQSPAQTTSGFELVVGLGNPGKAYAMTRHNMGFLVVEAFAKRHAMVLKQRVKLKGWTTRGVVSSKHGGETSVHLLMPSTYMNLSGEAVRSTIDYFGISAQKVLVVLDDAALPFGRTRVRLGGGSGGHNGLKSITAHLGTDNYLRVRIGIGDDRKGDLSGHVLGEFSIEERDQLENLIGLGVDIIEMALTRPVEEVMRRYNTSPQVAKKARQPKDGDQKKESNQQPCGSDT